MHEASAPNTTEGDRPPNVLTIVLDCARAKNFQFSGGDRVAHTPTIETLGASGTVFPRAVATANWTVPSHFSIFTGSYPNVHGVRTFQRVPGVPPTTADRLRAQGYETAMFTENLHLTGGYGLEAGFDRIFSRRMNTTREERTVVNRLTQHAGFLYSRRMRRLLERLPPLVAPLSMAFHSAEVAYKRDVCGPETVAAFGDWIAGRDSGRPFYVFVNLVDTHDPYELVANGDRVGFLDRAYATAPGYYLLSVPGLQSHVPWDPLVRGYLRSIEQADRKVGEMVRHLERVGERDRTLIVVTSDHGQSFGEAGNVNHGCGTTDSVVRVPLVVTSPKGLPAPSRVERWVSLSEVDGWIQRVVAGTPFLEEGGAGAPPIVYCEGGPVSDQVRSLKGIGTEHDWNRRHLVAFRGEEKWVLDVESGRLRRWYGSGDYDRSAAEEIPSDRAGRLRAEIFGPYEATEEARRRAAEAGAKPVDVEVDERLRSWGYD